jgi:hypothetical protein
LAGLACREIFNALVEKVEILSPTHFLLKSRMRAEKNIYRCVSTIITMDIYVGCGVLGL